MSLPTNNLVQLFIKFLTKDSNSNDDILLKRSLRYYGDITSRGKLERCLNEHVEWNREIYRSDSYLFTGYKIVNQNNSYYIYVDIENWLTLKGAFVTVETDVDMVKKLIRINTEQGIFPVDIDSHASSYNNVD